MTIFANEISDEVAEEMDNYVSENARFEQGDKVTIPHEDYHQGGYVMTIKKPMWTLNNLCRTEEQTGMDEFTHISETMDSYDPARDFGPVYLYNISYVFEEDMFHRTTETSLIPWSEYDGQMNLPTNDYNDFKYVTEEDCDVCGCNRLITRGFDNGHVGGHRKYCPVCDDVKELMTP